MELTAKNVRTIFSDCLFTPEEVKAAENGVPENVVKVEGVVNNFGFHAERLESHRQDVIGFLSQVQDGFKEESPEQGLSFIQLAVTKSGSLWGEHPSMEQLMCLAIGLNLMTTLLPRKLWFLTMGVPMLQIPKGSLN